MVKYLASGHLENGRVTMSPMMLMVIMMETFTEPDPVLSMS